MIEPEMAFYDLNDNMDLAEDFIKKVLKYVISDCKEDLEFLNTRLINEEKTKPAIERNELNLIERLNFVVDNDFKRISYGEAYEILRNSKPNKRKNLNFILTIGVLTFKVNTRDTWLKNTLKNQ